MKYQHLDLYFASIWGEWEEEDNPVEDGMLKWRINMAKRPLEIRKNETDEEYIKLEIKEIERLKSINNK